MSEAVRGLLWCSAGAYSGRGSRVVKSMAHGCAVLNMILLSYTWLSYTWLSYTWLSSILFLFG